MLKPTVRYSTDTKFQARDILVNQAKQMGHPIRRVLTMPSLDASCARRFKVEFGSYVVGIDISADVVRKWDNDAVDEIYCGNIFGLAYPETRYAVPKAFPSIGGGVHMRCAGKIAIEGKFDLMYLDYTSMLLPDPPTATNVGGAKLRETSVIIERYAAQHACVGVTFTHRRGNDPVMEDALLRGLAPTWKPPLIHRYHNLNSDMILAVFVR